MPFDWVPCGPALNPQEGVVNSTYLEILEEIVNQLEKYGMYVIMDMHQESKTSYLPDLMTVVMREYPGG